MRGEVYFKHDFAVHMQPRMLALIATFGYKGYGWFWTVVEMLRGEPDYKIMIDEYTLVALQSKLSTPTEGIVQKQSIKDFITFCVDAGIFFVQDGHVGAVFLIEQMEHMEKIIELRKEAGKKGGRPRKQQPAFDGGHGEIVEQNIEFIRSPKTNCLPFAKQEESISKPNQKQKKPDKIRLDEIRLDEIKPDKDTAVPKKSKTDVLQLGEFVRMSAGEFAKLQEQFGDAKANRMVEVLDNYKGSSGKKYKSDYRAILSWVVDRVEKEGSNARNKRGVDFTADPAGIGFDGSGAIDELQQTQKQKRSL